MNPLVRFLSFTSLAALALARPFVRDPTPSDFDILNFVLTLEHIENAFYSQGLARFTQKDFVDAGFPAWSYGRLKQIAAHEVAHVEVLEVTLGGKATKPCTYKFPYNDPKSFVALGHTLEVVVDSAYTGTFKLFDNKEYALAAATIASTESRHSAWFDSALMKRSAWSGPFGTPLDLNQAFTIASSFVTSCPPTNPTLPAAANAQLTLPEPSSAWPGSTTPVEFTAPNSLDHSAPLYGAFMSGQEAVVVPLVGKSVSIPNDLRGVVFLLITTDADNLDDSKTIAGPALLEFPFDSNGKLQRQMQSY